MYIHNNTTILLTILLLIILIILLLLLLLLLPLILLLLIIILIIFMIILVIVIVLIATTVMVSPVSEQDGDVPGCLRWACRAEEAQTLSLRSYEPLSHQLVIRVMLYWCNLYHCYYYYELYNDNNDNNNDNDNDNNNDYYHYYSLFPVRASFPCFVSEAKSRPRKTERASNKCMRLPHPHTCTHT